MFNLSFLLAFNSPDSYYIYFCWQVYEVIYFVYNRGNLKQSVKYMFVLALIHYSRMSVGHMFT